ncbi:hypothetical protein EJ06DRAFT_522124 [Trichodelitschia bisporula]|uniref:Uncharacterized protein n=1 Tax=Trichodelitschia bisporula TaxID=703511 RepID=A0A6G1HVQ6_9PEZI|nr:hypothetical protein EJ06DRAFT_522124 [Trichodelitschia bisporula]
MAESLLRGGQQRPSSLSPSDTTPRGRPRTPYHTSQRALQRTPQRTPQGVTCGTPKGTPQGRAKEKCRDNTELGRSVLASENLSDTDITEALATMSPSFRNTPTPTLLAVDTKSRRRTVMSRASSYLNLGQISSNNSSLREPFNDCTIPDIVEPPKEIPHVNIEQVMNSLFKFITGNWTKPMPPTYFNAILELMHEHRTVVAKVAQLEIEIKTLKDERGILYDNWATGDAMVRAEVRRLEEIIKSGQILPGAITDDGRPAFSRAMSESHLMGYQTPPPAIKIDLNEGFVSPKKLARPAMIPGGGITNASNLLDEVAVFENAKGSLDHVARLMTEGRGITVQEARMVLELCLSSKVTTINIPSPNEGDLLATPEGRGLGDPKLKWYGGLTEDVFVEAAQPKGGELSSERMASGNVGSSSDDRQPTSNRKSARSFSFVNGDDQSAMKPSSPSLLRAASSTKSRIPSPKVPNTLAAPRRASSQSSLRATAQPLPDSSPEHDVSPILKSSLKAPGRRNMSLSSVASVETVIRSVNMSPPAGTPSPDSIGADAEASAKTKDGSSPGTGKKKVFGGLTGRKAKKGSGGKKGAEGKPSPKSKSSLKSKKSSEGKKSSDSKESKNGSSSDGGKQTFSLRKSSGNQQRDSDGSLDKGEEPKKGKKAQSQSKPGQHWWKQAMQSSASGPEINRS